jgi:hypothetical protein
MSRMGTETQQLTVTVYMVLFGAGMGLVLGTLILAVQNEVHPKDLGAGTSSVTFFRSVGGAVGVALFGAVFNALLRNKIGRSAAVGEGSSFSPTEIRKMEPVARAEYIAAFADSLTKVFLFTVPLLVAAWVFTWFIHEVPLRAATHDDEGNLIEPESALGALH